MYKKSIAGLMLAALAVCGATQASETFPNRAIRFVVPFGPGSGTDLSARLIARKLTEITGQPVVTENRPGANGFIAVQAVTRADPDGYTVLVGSNSTLATNVALFKSMPYDPVVDLAPVGMVMSSPMLLIAPSDSPFNSVQDVIAAARREPGKLSYASGSAAYQLMGELFSEKAGIKLLNVPYKGAGETVVSVLSKQTDLGVVDVTASIAQIRSGQVKALGVAAPQRLKKLDQVPTLTEQGVSGADASTWVAVALPAKTPAAVQQRLSTLLSQIMSQPDVIAFYDNQDVVPLNSTSAEMGEFQRKQIELWQNAAKVANVPLQ